MIFLDYYKKIYNNQHVDGFRLQIIYHIGMLILLSSILVAPFREWLGFGWWFILWVLVVQRICGHYATLFYHRMLCHNHFTVVPWFERLVVLLSPMALQGYPAGYVIVHLMHHKYADQEGDPHPPVSATRRRWVNLVFPFLHDSKELELKLIIKFMRRPGQKFITKYYWYMVAFITVLFCIVNYKLLFIWLAGTQLGIFMGYMLNTYGHNPPDSKLYFWKHYRGDIDSTHKAVNLPGWSLQGRGENWHYVHHTYPNRWNFHPEAEQGKLDQNAWIIDKLVKLGIAEVKTPV